MGNNYKYSRLKEKNQIINFFFLPNLVIVFFLFLFAPFPAFSEGEPGVANGDGIEIEDSGSRRSKAEVDQLVFQIKQDIESGLPQDPSEKWLRKNDEDKEKYVEQKDFAHAVHASEKIIEKAMHKKQQGLDFSEELSELMEKKKLIEASNEALQLEFSETAQRCVDEGFSSAILERHKKMVENYNINVQVLLDSFEELEELIGKNAFEKIPDVMQQIDEFLETYQSINEPPILNNGLPNGMTIIEAPTIEVDTEEIPSMMPTETGESEGTITNKSISNTGVASLSGGGIILMAVSGPPATEDTDPTIDVQITDEIVDLAATLNNSPLEIFEYVRNNFNFEPYLGSRKGSQETLTQESGNDYDLSSLLIALLRASDIPARYVQGTVEIPSEKVMNWLGVEDAYTAASILSTAGLEGVNVLENEEIVAIRFKHVWVEAYIPYTNYRGIPADDTGEMWVPMDPSFKEYDYQTGMEILTEMGFDAEAFIDDYITTFHEPSPVELMMEQVQDYLTANYPEMTYEDIVRTREIAMENLGFIPGSIPFEVLTVDDDFAEIPSDQRYQVRFHLYDGGTTFINYSADLPAIAGKRVTISYVPATQADEDVIISYGGLYDTPPYLVYLKPVLKIDGVDVAVSENSIGMGMTHSSDMHFTTPVGENNEMPVVENSIIAGTYQAIGINTGRIDPDIFMPGADGETPSIDDITGGKLWKTAMGYLDRIKTNDDQIAKTMQMVVTKDVSEAIVENAVSVTYSLGTPQTFEWTGLIVDADRCIIGPFAVNGDESKEKPFMVLSGADGSISENRIFEDMYDEEAISAIKILELASDMGIPIYKFDSDNIGSIYGSLNLSTSLESSIYSSVANGHEVTVPRSNITYLEWYGTGYIDMDPESGAAGYIISGGHSGGATVDVWISWKMLWGVIAGEIFHDIDHITADITFPYPDGEYFPSLTWWDFFTSNQLHFDVTYTIHFDDKTTAPPIKETYNPSKPYPPGNYTFYAGWGTGETRGFIVFGVEIEAPDGESAIVDCDTITLAAKCIPSAPPSPTYQWNKSWSMSCPLGSGDGTLSPVNAASTELQGTASGSLAVEVEVASSNGSTKTKNCIEVIDVKSIKAQDGSNEKEDNDPSSSITDLNTIIVAKSATGDTIDITVETDPFMSEAELPSGWADIRKKVGSGSLNLASTGKLSATVDKDTAGEMIVEIVPGDGYSKAYEVRIIVVGLDKLTLTDNDHSSTTKEDTTSEDITPTDNTVMLQTDTSNGIGNLGMDLTWIPSSASRTEIGDKLKWKIENYSGSGSVQNWGTSEGDFSSASTSDQWTEPTGYPNTEFRLYAWYDANENDNMDTDEEHRMLTISLTNRVKLGQDTASSSIYGLPSYFKTYVPTKWGGQLTVGTTAGTLSELSYPSGASYTNSTETGEGEHGWYTFKIDGSNNYRISTQFLQVGSAAATPWNGWYWPSLDSINPNLYDTTGSYTPLNKYDLVYGTDNAAEEKANYSGGSGWYGHCWGWSLAAIAIPQPAATTKAGITFSQDEMEGLYTELADDADGWQWRIGKAVYNEIPSSPCTSASGEAIDDWPDELHNGFRQYIRQQKKAMFGDLRDCDAPLDSSEVWNHDIYQYKSYYKEAPGDNYQLVNISTQITTNLDVPAMPSDGTTRNETYVYTLEYLSDGTIDGSSTNQNWISSSHLPPSCIGTVEGPLIWNASHCSITKANVDALY